MTRPPAIEARDLATGMSGLPRAVTTTHETITGDANRLVAVMHDFFSQLLGLEARAAFLTDLFATGVDTNQARILLAIAGFCAHPPVLVAIKEAISILATRIDAVEHVGKEIKLLAMLVATVVNPDAMLASKDRQEELARKIIKIFGIGVAGETVEESRARLENLDSVELQKLAGELEVIIRKQVQDRLAAQAAAAAAKPTRE